MMILFKKGPWKIHEKLFLYKFLIEYLITFFKLDMFYYICYDDSDDQKEIHESEKIVSINF